MNRWRWILVVLAAIFAVRAGFFPAERWWAIWGIILVAGGVCLHLHEETREKRAAEAMEEDTSCWGFYLSIAGAFLAGTGWALYHKLGWWSLGVGVLSVVVFFFSFIFAVMGGDKWEDEGRA